MAIWQPWTPTEPVPLAAVVLVSLAAGTVLTVPLWIQRWRLRSRLRSLEARAVPPEDKPPDSKSRLA